MSPTLQRPPAETTYADEIKKLAASDDEPKPPGWKLSPRAVRTFILGDANKGVRRKFVGNPSLVDRAMVALATGRGLMLVGEPGTAKSLLSELLAAAVSACSTHTIQGSAGTTFWSCWSSPFASFDRVGPPTVRPWTDCRPR